MSLVAILSTALLLVFILSSTLSQTILDRQTVQSWLTRPNSYALVEETASGSLTELTKLDEEVSDNNQVQQLINLVNSYFGPDRFTNISIQLTNAVFSWLETGENIDFEIKLFDTKKQLKDFFVDSQFLRLQSLEPCTNQQLADVGQDDLFNIQCRPDNLSKQKLRSQLEKTNNNQLDKLFNSTVISDESLNLNQTESDADQIRDAYQLVKSLPTVALVLAILLLTLALLAIRDWRKWLHYSSWLVIGAPSIVMILGLMLWHDESLRQAIYSSINAVKVDPQLLQSATEVIMIDVSRTLALQSFWLVATGVVGLVIVNWPRIYQALNKANKINFQPPTAG